MEKAITKYLRCLKIPVSKKYCERLILSHTEYPSLISVADVLHRLGVSFKIARIEKEDLVNLSFPYLLYYEKDNGEVKLIQKKADLRNNEIDFSFWKGLVLLCENDFQDIDAENTRLYREEKNKNQSVLLLSITFISIITSLLIQSNSWSTRFLFVTTLFGILAGYVIAARELGVKYSAVESFCKSSAKKSCDVILSSEKYIIKGLLKFSDAVFSFFVFQLLILSFSSIIPDSYTSLLIVLQVASLLTIPVVLFSIYYQYVIAKVWCNLCLTINAILIVQAIIFTIEFYTVQYRISELSIAAVLFSGLIFLVILRSFVLIKNFKADSNKIEQALFRYKRVANSASVFKYLLFQQKAIDAGSLDGELLIGKWDAPLKVVMATNLYCGPCKKHHKTISQIVSRYPDEINFAIRLVPIPQNHSSNEYLLKYWCQCISPTAKVLMDAEQLMNHWYEFMNLEEFKKKYHLDDLERSVEIDKLLSQHYDWITRNSISQTPTFFFNGFQMPKNYVLEDIVSFIPDLADNLKNTTMSSHKPILQHA